MLTKAHFYTSQHDTRSTLQCMANVTVGLAAATLSIQFTKLAEIYCRCTFVAMKPTERQGCSSQDKKSILHVGSLSVKVNYCSTSCQGDFSPWMTVAELKYHNEQPVSILLTFK